MAGFRKMDDLLVQAAKEWQRLSEYEYLFEYDYSKTRHKITLVFAVEDFYHVAGFPHLTDVKLPRMKSAKLVKLITDGKLALSVIDKSSKYGEMVLPRLQAIARLGDFLDGDCSLFTFNEQRYPFHTEIKANHLVIGKVEEITFVFIVRSYYGDKPVGDYHCCSTFTKGQRDYEYGQYRYILLKKVKRNICTGVEQVLYERDKQEGLKGIGYEI